MKPSYPAIFGIEKAKDEILKYCLQAKDSLEIFGSKAELFSKLVDYVRTAKSASLIEQKEIEKSC